jgi:hypothetical protein
MPVCGSGAVVSAWVSPDSQATACPPSGRNSTYRPVQISGTGSNLYTRFLLCPHKNIPEDNFIPDALSDELYDEAVTKLKCFELADILENPAMQQNIQRWLQRDFHLMRDNVTVSSNDFPVSLPDELIISLFTLEQLSSLSAIDLRLWGHIARRVDAFQAPEFHADQLFTQYVARIGQCGDLGPGNARADNGSVEFSRHVEV